MGPNLGWWYDVECYELYKTRVHMARTKLSNHSKGCCCSRQPCRYALSFSVMLSGYPVIVSYILDSYPVIVSYILGSNNNYLTCMGCRNREICKQCPVRDQLWLIILGFAGIMLSSRLEWSICLYKVILAICGRTVSSMLSIGESQRKSYSTLGICCLISLWCLVDCF